ncbi:type II toxin-antitoxin system VapC family toxin [Polynucleobacter paneuropaeus]|jgi:predicted nucleic acid-binding protein|nr:type II toxin-antitoxin system VapC family toxin [Polynucleobacter paneuropaeus]MBT8554563.1 type II toxin-antitoxin system VapC family toxin [Polynucleobacter paneuropaeus]MBT8559840.1 type II toxin-antitoxin system VapC family toxin [Polynucleobacter paneuropaeus]MBT8561280.1 type II toxin-antitoxin system VapC family toxin [Polynucleobacter paneuropaeus]QWD34734.1 type II toxin-antitoxin system VapC family toxin [Polynucleobacter paneuropaeus]
MYLLDTNIISELRRPKPHGAVLEWYKNITEEDLFISAVSIGEIQAGIELTRTQDKKKAEILEQWLQSISNIHNVLPMTGSTFRLWAKLMHSQTNTVREDAMIAATAIEKDLIVVTRNTKDFKRFKLQLLNPFEVLH